MCTYVDHNYSCTSLPHNKSKQGQGQVYFCFRVGRAKCTQYLSVFSNCVLSGNSVECFLHLWIDFNRPTFTHVKHLRAILIGRAPSVQPPDRRSWSDELSSSNRSTRLFVTRATNGDVTGVTCDHGGVNPTKAFFLLLLPSYRGSVESIRKCANTIILGLSIPTS